MILRKLFPIFVLALTSAAIPKTIGSVERLDPALDNLIALDAKIEVLADGFEWSEGPEWVPAGQYLLFTDIPKNTIYMWKEGEGVSVFLRPAGYTGMNPPGREVGSNGLMLDNEGRLVMCDHGNRCIARLNESNYTKEVLVSKYRGKRLNSPNDLVINSRGDIYFTDPPYGLEGQDNSASKELDFNGVYLLRANGELVLLTDKMTRPNGIAFSPDEKTLYVAQSDQSNLVIMSFPVKEDGTIGEGKVFFNAQPLKKAGVKGSCDGMAVDIHGNLFATGPGGVLVISPQGKHLGTIQTGQATANCTFGGKDGSELFITADMYLLRIPTKTKGVEFK